MILLNPTGGTIRTDAEGAGYFKAKRGNKLHRDLDFGLPKGIGQNVFSPITGLFVRVSIPEQNDFGISGGIIEGSYATIQMFYFSPIFGLVGKNVRQGQVVGYAQDVGLIHKGCEPHIHFRLLEIDPTIFF